MDYLRDSLKPLFAIVVGVLTPKAEFVVIVTILLIADFVLHTWQHLIGKVMLSEIAETFENSAVRFLKQIGVYFFVLVSASAFSKFEGFQWTEHTVYVGVAFVLFSSIAARASKVLGDVDLTEIVKNLLNRKPSG
jgi:glucan phosphoethanolaminetransferase (alkaline phosphatase superfamily)